MSDLVITQKLTPTIIEEYDQDKKNFKAFLADGDKPKTKPKNVDQQVVKTPVLQPNEDDGYGVKGGLDFDVNTGVGFGSIDPEDITGAEGLVDQIIKGAENILRMIKNFLIWIKETVFNKTVRLKDRISKLKNEIRLKGKSTQAEVQYPRTAQRLMVTPKITNNGLWVSESLKFVDGFLTDSINGMKAVEGYGNEVTGLFDDSRVHMVAEDAAMAYASAIKAYGSTGSLKTRSVTGYREFTVNVTRQGRLSDLRVNTRVTRRPPFGNHTFIPDLLVVDKIVQQLDAITARLSLYHQSQTSASRKFERSVKSLLDATNYPDNVSRLNAKRFYGWIVNFHQSLTSDALNYVYDSLSAGVDFCYANLRK